MHTALITGGSSGIGLELAHVMAEKGHDLVLCARDKTSLKQAASDLKKQFGVDVETVVADLSVPGSAKKLHNKVKEHDIEILVNNAGVGYVADFLESDLDRNSAMAQLNMVSLLELSHLFGNDFVDRGAGRILNIGSVAAFVPGPAQPVYYATKAFVRSFSRALAYKLKDRGVSVTVLHPGATKTHFFEQSNAAFMKDGASPRSVAQLGYEAMMSGRVEVTHGFSNGFIVNFLVRFVPYRWQVPIVDRASDV